MRKVAVLVAGVVALATGGIFAGTVIGDDGAEPLVDAIDGGGFDPANGEVERASSSERSAIAAGRGKVKIIKGSSTIRTVPGSGIDGITLRCPSRLSALSGGFEAQQPGLVPANISPALKDSGAVDKRGYFVGVINILSSDIDWRAWVTCAKGVKDVS